MMHILTGRRVRPGQCNPDFLSFTWGTVIPTIFHALSFALKLRLIRRLMVGRGATFFFFEYLFVLFLVLSPLQIVLRYLLYDAHINLKNRAQTVQHHLPTPSFDNGDSQHPPYLSLGLCLGT